MIFRLFNGKIGKTASFVRLGIPPSPFLHQRFAAGRNSRASAPEVKLAGPDPISPLEGEMPGRAEGGNPKHYG
ncbi:hypothetical protein ACO34A_06945 [Rhizobium sp. ACO-34A]|nr:hypothetical protein ACO34A_06945 [Rhizobium sp. ACO-34A]